MLLESLPCSQSNPGGIPIELLHTIIAHTIASSIHSVCMNPLANPPLWDMNVVRILSTVSFTFRQIVHDVAINIFGSAPSHLDIQTVMPIIDRDLVRIHRIGARIRGHYNFDISADLSERTDRSLFIQGYFLYLGVVGLRQNAPHFHDLTCFTHSLMSILDSLWTSLDDCATARPSGVGVFLASALVCEMMFTRSALAIVEACAMLADCLHKIPTSETDEEREQLIQLVLASLSRIEAAESDFVISLDPSFDQNRTGLLQGPRRVMGLPGVSEALTSCEKAEFLSGSDYNIQGRAGRLLQACRSMEKTLASYPWKHDE